MRELKPCPFCGGKASLSAYEYATNQFIYHIYCTNKFPDEHFCMGQGGARMTKKEAIAAWNQRVEVKG